MQDGGEKKGFLHTERQQQDGINQTTFVAKLQNKTSSLDKSFGCDCCEVLLNGGCTHVLSEFEQSKINNCEGIARVHNHYL